MDATLTFRTLSLPTAFGSLDRAMSSSGTAHFLPTHEDFGVLVDTTSLFNARVGPYRVVRPLDVLTFKNSDGYSSTFAAFPRIVGVGNTDFEARKNAVKHLLHSRNFYASLSPASGTPDAKRQSMLMKQYLQ